MSKLKTYPMNSSAILRINSEKEIIDPEPEYQRNGDIWSIEKRQLLIDSILNDYDIPKIYFHVLPLNMRKKDNKSFTYAIIDGRQRLETIWKFINGDFTLADDFKLFEDESIQANSLSYADLAKKYPKLKIRFDSFSLPIICVDTDDLELIEDMFSRLNEAVPLNSAEKRNAIGGPMAKMINTISNHEFFKQKARFPNNRYQHKELSVKILYIEHSYKSASKFADTKKPYLDNFVRTYKSNRKLNATMIGNNVKEILNIMNEIFISKDNLLRAQSIVPVYYLLFRDAKQNNRLEYLTRENLVRFKKEIDDNRKTAELDIAKANFDLLEFDRLSIQGTNDSNNLKERFRIIKEYLEI